MEEEEKTAEHTATNYLKKLNTMRSHYGVVPPLCLWNMTHRLLAGNLWTVSSFIPTFPASSSTWIDKRI